MHSIYKFEKKKIKKCKHPKPCPKIPFAGLIAIKKCVDEKVNIFNSNEVLFVHKHRKSNEKAPFLIQASPNSVQ